MLDEFDLIRRFFTAQLYPAHIKVGVGDDCAVLTVPAGCELAVSVDTQLLNVHFPADAMPDLMASRALHCAASDLAAMGATPLGFTLALTLPESDENWLTTFSSGLFAAASQLRCPLIGGDTTRGALAISVQVLGATPQGAALKRSGAQVGDGVWVTGSLGDGAAALAVIEQCLMVSESARAYLLERFYRPTIDFELASQLRGIASACIDISDGLLADLGHICTASSVAASVDVTRLPISKQWLSSVNAQQAQDWALTGGDDYRLCFTASPNQSKVLQASANLFCIGEIIKGSGVSVTDSSGAVALPSSTGFRHF